MQVLVTIHFAYDQREEREEKTSEKKKMQKATAVWSPNNLGKVLLLINITIWLEVIAVNTVKNIEDGIFWLTEW